MKTAITLSALFIAGGIAASTAQELREVKIYNGEEVVLKMFAHEIDEIKVEDREDYPDIQPEWNLQEMPFGMVENSKVYAFKDKLYDGLFTRTLGWNGGDGVQTTQLPGGHIMWSFNDSFYGVVNPVTRARGGCSFPRNTVMIQEADATGFPGEEEKYLHWTKDMVQTTNPNAGGYYQARTFIRHPKASLTEQQIKDGNIDQDYLYWAGDATVVDGQLQMIWNAVDQTMTGLNSCLAIYDLEGEPGDDTYMKVVYEDHDFFPADRLCSYGGTLWEDEDGHTYLYGTYNSGFLDNRPLVARTATHDLRSQWEYYVKNEDGTWEWITTPPTKEQLDRSQITEHTLSLPWVFEEDGTYYLVSQTFPFGHEYVIFRSEHPWGPFVDRRELMKFPTELDKLGVRTFRFTYMVHLHQGLSREGELVISTNTDTDSFWDNFNAVGSADFYRPYFYRIYNWKSVYDE